MGSRSRLPAWYLSQLQSAFGNARVKLCDSALYVFQQSGDVGTPTLQGILTLCQKLMTLIHGSDARNRPTLVVEHLVGYVWSNAKSGHS